MGGLVVLGWDNVSPLVEIGLADLPNIGGAKAPPAPTLRRPCNKDKELTHEPNGEPEARTLEYFKNINQTVIQTLYEMYKIDFELFNYNMNGLTR